ncbi:MAG: hypothetical protein COA42_02265 [Alteromonadaceae bacterium]|nr:MAG: hypothetical protein COA42_02265 [Alteromonadaceae bacterium]
MKKLTLVTSVASAVALSFAASMPVQAEPSFSGNVGFVSDYYFRGANLGDGGVYAGLDYENSGLYVGTWWIDDATGGNDGMENDWYIGYGQESDSFSWNIGYNNYQYTYSNDFEHEVVLTLGAAGFSLDLVLGEDDDVDTDAEDYSIALLGYSHGAYGITVGHFEFNDIDDSDYQWIEASVSGDIVEGISATLSIGAKAADGENNDGYMVLDLSKSFDL